MKKPTWDELLVRSLTKRADVVPKNMRPVVEIAKYYKKSEMAVMMMLKKLPEIKRKSYNIKCGRAIRPVMHYEL
jgi:hypothetical protein